MSNRFSKAATEIWNSCLTKAAEHVSAFSGLNHTSEGKGKGALFCTSIRAPFILPLS